MTSREAIEIAKKAVIVAKQQRQNEADDEENEWFDSNIEALEQAENDLKDGNVYVGNKMDMLLGIEDYYKGEEESYNKIKECLEK